VKRFNLMDYDRRTAALHTRLFMSMNMDDAKEVLGFPPDYSPSPGEIAKAYKNRAIQFHPDRGGDPRKMVELNVAKEILDGKRTRDLTKRYEEEDPVAKARQEAERKIQRGLATIKVESNKVLDAFHRALSSVEINPKWKRELKEFLTDDLADALDLIQDTEAPEKAHKDWKTAFDLVHSLSSKALRMGSKFTALKRKHAYVSAGLVGLGASEDVTFDAIFTLYSETTKFVSDFKALRTESGKLMSLIVTSEEVPLAWDDIYSRCHSIITQFDEDFGELRLNELQRYGDQIKKSVDEVLTVLSGFDADAGFPDWKKWKYPADFSNAAEIIAKKRESKMASC
jgi:hypothetical protein